jgi:hypothetical protein
MTNTPTMPRTKAVHARALLIEIGERAVTMR